MKRWALLILAIYLLMLLVLVVPSVVVLGDNGASNILEVFGLPIFWCWIGALLLGEALLLFVPVSLTQRRLRPRRSLFIPLFATTFFLWILAFSAGACICFALWDDHSHRTPPSENHILVFSIIATLLLWSFWTWLFLRYRRTTDPAAFVPRLMRHLLAGSILELLIAVPSHIIVRQRDECCSPALTGIGIYTGIAVMLMSFGPGIFLLYAQRLGRLRPDDNHPTCPHCGYDLRATPTRCPECGTIQQT